jgi:hypothetical protein
MKHLKINDDWIDVVLYACIFFFYIIVGAVLMFLLYG